MAQKYKVGSKRYTLAQMLANPRLRSHLPDSKLPPEMLAMRKENKRLKAPAGPGSSMTVRDIEGILKGQFGGQESAIAQRQKEIPQWYTDYRSRLGNMQWEQGARTAAQNSAISGIAQSAAQNAQSANGYANNASAKDNAISGVDGVDPAALLRQQAAENVRQTGIGSYQGLNNALGGVQQSFLQGANAISYGQESNAKSDLTNMYNKLQATKKSAYDDILSTEQKNKLTDAAFNLKSADTAADNARQDKTASATIKGTKARTKKTQADLDYFKKHGYYPGTKPKGSKSANEKDQYGNTPKQRQSANDGWTAAVHASRTALGANKDFAKLGVDALAQAIRAVDSSVSSAYARIAAERAIAGGKLSKSARRRLKRDGAIK